MSKANRPISVVGTRVMVSNGSLDCPPSSLTSHTHPDSINIDLIGDRYRLTVTSYRRMQEDPTLAPTSRFLPVSPPAVSPAVQECLSFWQKVVDLRREFAIGHEFPFQEFVDLSSKPQLLKKFGPMLALAGHNLYMALFGKPEPQSEVIELIRSVTAQPNHFTIRSNELFAPWPLLYSCPDGGTLNPTGSNWEPAGFWGIRHILDHRIDEHDHYGNIQLANNVLRISLNYDSKIDRAGERPVIGLVRRYLESYPPPPALEIPERTTTESLLGALGDGDFSERIAYFCCHQNDDPPAIVLEDDQPITAATLINAAETGHPRGFEKALFVFFNTCQGGRVSGRLVQSFVPAWLRLDANCVLGAQVDVPTLFAQAYAERFFERVLDGRTQFGQAVRELATEFMVERNNPLGLIYCLYRGSTARIVTTRAPGL